MQRSRWLLLLAGILALEPGICTLPLHAQTEPVAVLSPDLDLPRVTRQLTAELDRVDELLAAGQTADAFDRWQTLRQHEQAQSWYPLEADEPGRFVRYITLEEVCRQWLSNRCRDHEPLRAWVSQRWEREAESLLALARQASHDTQLISLVQAYPGTAASYQAWRLLGDAAIARGDAAFARWAWQQAEPFGVVSAAAARTWQTRTGLPWYRALYGRPLPQENPELMAAIVGSATSLQLGDYGARLVVASQLEGDVRRAAWELNLLQRVAPDAQGRLGQRRGTWVELLTKWREAESSLVPLPPTKASSPLAAPREPSDKPPTTLLPTTLSKTAEFPLTRVDGERDLLAIGRHRVAEDAAGLMSYHPHLVNDQLLLSDGQKVQAWQAATGAVAWEMQLRDGEPPQPLTERQQGGPRFTLTSGEGVVALTLPSPLIPQHRAPTVRRSALSRLVAIDLATRKLVCSVTVPDATWAFGGSPAICDGRLYALLYHLSDTRTRVFAVAHDLTTGRELWRQFLSAADTPGAARFAEYWNASVCIEHDRVYCQTNLGVVAALNGRDGSPRWLMRYPRATFPASRSDQSDRHFQRDGGPCLIYRDQVICLAADCDRIFALGAADGQLLWTTAAGEAADAVHLLGAQGDTLLASGDALYWVDLLSGQVLTLYPEYMPVATGGALPTPRGWGRGVLWGDAVLWPTRDAIHVLAVEPRQVKPLWEPQVRGKLDLAKHGVAGGNLVRLPAGLAIAGSERIWFLSIEERPLGEPATKKNAP